MNTPEQNRIVKLNRRRRNSIVVAEEIARRGGACEGCGHPNLILSRGAFLVWHHRDPSTKHRAVSELIGSVSPARVQAEMDKCDLLCPNCHVVVHHE